MVPRVRLSANLVPRPKLGVVSFGSRLGRGEAVLEVLDSLDHSSVLLDIYEDCGEPPSLGHEKDLLARTKLIELMAKLAPQVISGNHTGNCHINPIVDPQVNGRVTLGRPANSHRQTGLAEGLHR